MKEGDSARQRVQPDCRAEEEWATAVLECCIGERVAGINWWVYSKVGFQKWAWLFYTYHEAKTQTLRTTIWNGWRLSFNARLLLRVVVVGVIRLTNGVAAFIVLTTHCLLTSHMHIQSFVYLCHL